MQLKTPSATMEIYTLPPRMQNLRLKRHLKSRRQRAVNNNATPHTAPVDESSCHAVKPIEIRQVWASNLVTEFHRIRKAIANGFNIAALDTEFPGCPFVPDGVSDDYRVRSSKDHYEVMKANVDRLKIIQVGITLVDMLGNLPDFGSDKRVVWEFNFMDFDIDEDEGSPDSLKLLASQGIDFQKLKKLGIRPDKFANLMVWSGLIGRSAAWITFQGGIDLAFILKMLIRGYALPCQLERFNGLVQYYFGAMVFDVKHMMKYCDSLYGGLNKVAETLKVEREAGESHCAGSDSLLTAAVFNKMVQIYFPAGEGHRFAGQLHNFA